MYTPNSFAIPAGVSISGCTHNMYVGVFITRVVPVGSGANANCNLPTIAVADLRRIAVLAVASANR